VRVQDPRFYAETAFGGSVGAGEAYMQGFWSADDLTAAMRILLQNREVLDGMESGWARLAALCGAVARACDLRLVHLEDIGPHYAKTLRAWRDNLFANVARVRALGYSEAFLRMWEFYLCYCEAGFEERALGDAQMLFIKPQSRIELPV
jgi:hypothetical protein